MVAGIVFAHGAAGGVVLELRVKTGRQHFSLFPDGTLEATERPENNRVNMEIVRELGRMFRCDAVLLSGLKSRNKTILLKGVAMPHVEKILSP